MRKRQAERALPFDCNRGSRQIFIVEEYVSLSLRRNLVSQQQDALGNLPVRWQASSYRRQSGSVLAAAVMLSGWSEKDLPGANAAFS